MAFLVNSISKLKRKEILVIHTHIDGAFEELESGEPHRDSHNVWAELSLHRK